MIVITSEFVACFFSENQTDTMVMSFCSATKSYFLIH